MLSAMKTANSLSRQCSAAGEGARRYAASSCLSGTDRPPGGRLRPAVSREPYAAVFSKSGRGSSQTNARHLRTERIPARGNFSGRNPTTRFRNPAL